MSGTKVAADNVLSPTPRPEPPPATAWTAAVGVLARWLPALSVLGFVAVVLAATDTAIWDIVRYAWYVGWALLLPGTLVYRALRSTPHTFVDDVAMGAAVGLALEIVAWAGYSALDLRGWLWTWPAAVAVPFLAVPSLRRHWRPRGYQRVPLAWSWCVAVIVIAVIAYLAAVFLDGPPPVPTGGTYSFFPDLHWMLAFAGEAKHHFPMGTPQVVGEPLHYHWFAYAHEAASSLISGVDTPVVVFRFATPLICVVSVVLFATVGSRVSGRLWAGPVAAALFFVVGELSVRNLAIGPFGGVFLVGVWGSHSQAYMWPATLATVAVVADRLADGYRGEGGPARRVPGLGRGGWPLLALFCLWASGARVTVLLVVLGGVGLVALVELLKRRLRRVTLAAGAVVLAAEVFGAVILLGLERSPLAWQPFGVLLGAVPSTVDRPLWKTVGVFGIAAVAYVVYMMARLAGIPVLAWLARRDRRDGDGAPERVVWGPVEWFLLGGFLAGLAATLLLGNRDWAQVNFVRTGYLPAALLSAAGYVALVERKRVPARTVAVIVASAVVAAGAVFAALLWSGLADTGPGVRGMRPIVANAAGVLAVLAVGAVGWHLLRRRFVAMRDAGAVAALSVVLAAGVPGIVWDASGKQFGEGLAYAHYLPAVTPDRLAAALWLRAHSDPDDVVAINHNCPDPLTCQPRWEFWFEAYSERRQLVGTWIFAPRVYSDPSLRFWDPALLAENDAAFSAPTVDGLARLYEEHGVRWLVVVRSLGIESPALRQLATLRFEQGEMAVYQVSRR